MLKAPRLVRRLLGDRRAAVAATVAIALPALLSAAGAATDISLIGVKTSQLQAAADAGAAAGRQALDPFSPSPQTAPVTQAQLLANGNMASSLAEGDVEQGWWDIKAKTFGPPTTGQTGNPFSNAVRVTTRQVQKLAFGPLIGIDTVNLSRRSIAYKCSNTDYPLTVIPDDAAPPTKPAIWMSWSEGTSAPHSYYYPNPDGHKNPVIKFWSPTDGDDVSFVLTLSDGSQLQVDTYCRGTFLVVPDAFDYTGLNHNITASILRGSTNNSFAVYPGQPDPKYPLDSYTTAYYYAGATTNKYLSGDDVHTTPYPNAGGCCQYWASIGDPTPDRRSILTN